MKKLLLFFGTLALTTNSSSALESQVSDFQGEVWKASSSIEIEEDLDKYISADCSSDSSYLDAYKLHQCSEKPESCFKGEREDLRDARITFSEKGESFTVTIKEENFLKRIKDGVNAYSPKHLYSFLTSKKYPVIPLSTWSKNYNLGASYFHGEENQNYKSSPVGGITNGNQQHYDQDVYPIIFHSFGNPNCSETEVIKDQALTARFEILKSLENQNYSRKSDGTNTRQLVYEDSYLMDKETSTKIGFSDKANWLYSYRKIGEGGRDTFVGVGQLGISFPRDLVNNFLEKNSEIKEDFSFCNEMEAKEICYYFSYYLKNIDQNLNPSQEFKEKMKNFYEENISNIKAMNFLDANVLTGFSGGARYDKYKCLAWIKKEDYEEKSSEIFSKINTNCSSLETIPQREGEDERYSHKNIYNGLNCLLSGLSGKTNEEGNTKENEVQESNGSPSLGSNGKKIELYKGRNLISFTENTKKSFLSGNCKILSSYYYNSENGNWEKDIETFEKHKGYWLKVESNCKINY